MTGLKLGILIMPVSILLMILKQKGPAEKFRKAGAVSPEMARKPSSVEIERRFVMEGLVKRGVLVATGDGRYWLDERRYRRRVRMTAALVVVSVLAIVAIGLWIWSPWEGGE